MGQVDRWRTDHFRAPTRIRRLQPKFTPCLTSTQASPVKTEIPRKTHNPLQAGLTAWIRATENCRKC